MSALDTLPAVRNLNPGNLEYNPHDPFLGLANPPNDGKWCVFTDAVYGIRAIMVVLHTIYVKHGLTTTAQIINHYAPPTENNTQAYVDAVCHWNDWQEDDQLDFGDGATYVGFAQAIAVHESGLNPNRPPNAWYDDSTYEKAYSLTPFGSGQSV